jgi:hypothetical protein
MDGGKWSSSTACATIMAACCCFVHHAGLARAIKDVWMGSSRLWEWEDDVVCIRQLVRCFPSSCQMQELALGQQVMFGLCIIGRDRKSGRTAPYLKGQETARDRRPPQSSLKIFTIKFASSCKKHSN